MIVIWAAIQEFEGGGTTWIMASGLWSDAGEWIDGDIWND